jgi:AraC-like DNA-binding protein
MQCVLGEVVVQPALQQQTLDLGIGMTEDVRSATRPRCYLLNTHASDARDATARRLAAVRSAVAGLRCGVASTSAAAILAAAEGGKADRAMDRRTVHVWDTRRWTTAKTLDDFAVLCCEQPHLELRNDPTAFSLRQRAARMGPITLCEFVTGSDVSMDSGDHCSGYRINVVQAGYLESSHRGSKMRAGPGTLAVYQPEGHAAAKWAAGSRMLAVKIDRWAVEDVLSAALRRQVTSLPDLTPAMPTEGVPTQSWVEMLLLLKEQLFRPDGLLNQPMVGVPFVDSLVRGFLVAASSAYRSCLAEDAGQAPPHAIRAAIAILEEEAHLPTTVTSLAARTHVSVRALQQGFRDYLGMSPMTYLREVRLRRAHQMLQDCDPSAVTVASVAYQWGFSNLGRFSAAHTHRYGESPSETLRRSVFHTRQP